MNRSFLKISVGKAGVGKMLPFYLLVVCCVLSACGDQKPVAPNPASIPVTVNVYEAHPERASFFDLFPATVTALMQVDIHAETEGYVTGIFFKEGDHVTKGQKLYTIDDSKYTASNNSARANVKVATSNLDQAQKDADRYTYLSQHDAVAKQILDHAMTTLQNAKDQLTAAKQDLAKTQTDLNYAVIKAPFDGTIGISQVRLGNTVIAGQTVLNTVSTDNPMAVDFVVNEKQIARFVKLKQNKPAAKDSVFTLALPDNSIYPLPGEISFIDRGVNPLTGSITIRLVFPNPSSMLRAGMSGTVRVRNSDTAKQLMIPSKAIVEQMGEYFVYIAKDTVLPAPADAKDKGNAAQPQGAALVALQRKVQLGQTVADRVIVKSGIESGDNVIIDGVQKLHPGSRINIASPAH